MVGTASAVRIARWSGTRFWLSGRSTCALFLSLPFRAVSPELRGYVAELEALLPFRLSPKQWSRWRLNAQGTRYYKRRVVPPTEW